MSESVFVSWADYKHFALFDVQKYYINDGIVMIEKGLVSKKMYSLPMYKVMSVELRRSMTQRIFGLCTIVLCIRDECEESIALENICYDGRKMYLDMISTINESYRRAWFDWYL